MARKSGKIGDIQETLKDYNIGIKDITGNDIFIRCFSKEAAKVPDYRHPSYVKHKLGGYPFHMYPWISCRL